MNIFLWMLQVLLAAAFAAHARLYLFPPANLAPLLNAAIRQPLRIFIGIAETMAAIGLLLPGVTRILPWLTSWAAAGLMIVTFSAAVFHSTRGEVNSAITTAILFAMVTFVAYMRWKVRPIMPRGATESIPIR